MELHNLRPAKGSVHKVKRIARGQGSGHGGTSTRGHKGDKARAGHKNKRNFEGGQTPMQRRLPKRGFNNINRVEYVGINVARLQDLANKFQVTSFDHATLVNLGVVGKNDLVKILGAGELSTAISVKDLRITASAAEKIQAAGGSVSTTEVVAEA
jgi:large subunit ribosomal protein L15